MTPARDPVRDMRAMAWAAGFAEGRRTPTAGTRLRWLAAGVLIGAAGMLWSASAFAQVPVQAEQYRRDLVRAAQATFGLDAPIATLGGQIAQESAFRPGAVSWAGAQGLSQMMPATAAGLARQYAELRPVNAFDPRWSLRAQSILMRDLVRSSTARDECGQWQKALASYNQGPGWTRRAERLADDPSRWFGSVERINPGKSPSAYRETVDYVRRILLTHEPRFVAAMWGRGVCRHYGIGRS